jgi:hypothetical protein
MWPGDRYASMLGEIPQAAGDGVPVHPGTAVVEQNRPACPVSYSPVDGPADRGRQRDKDNLAALAAHAKDTVTMLLAQVRDVSAGGLEDPQAHQPEHGNQRQVIRVGGLTAAVSMASNCSRLNPSVGDSGGTGGRRTCSAGECSSTPSITQVR